MTTIIISNEKMNDMKIINSHGESSLLVKELVKHVNVKQNKKKTGGFLGALGAILLGNLLGGRGTIRVDEGTIRAEQCFQCRLIF